MSVELLREPVGFVPYPFLSQGIQTLGGNTAQLIRIDIPNILIPVQGGTVADATLTIDHIDGLQTFPDIVPVTNFLQDFLTTYPFLNDFYQNISTNATQTILNNSDFLGLTGTLDSLSVELRRTPANILRYPFFTESIGTETGSLDQNVSVEVEDILIPVQGGTVADMRLNINHVDGLQSFPDIALRIKALDISKS
ncbi:MAG: hypothetical protein AAGJ08_03465 [Cyanobacteria bacterium P01_H01_bin.35]